MDNELLAALREAEKAEELVLRMSELVQVRARRDPAGCGMFGIAVNNDAEAVKWRKLNTELQQIKLRRKAAIAMAIE